MEAKSLDVKAGVELLPCDLVMQGGITSGVVYPGAVIELSRKYHFVNVGGASAGAIAAAATAAAEFGRQTGKPGFDALEKAMSDVRKPGFLLGLFQPTPRTTLAFNVLLRLATSRTSWRSRIAVAFLTLILPPGQILLTFGVAVVLALVVRVWMTSVSLPLTSRWLLIVLAIATWFLLAIAMALLRLVFEINRLFAAVRRHGYGLCPGSRQHPSTQQALTEWIFSKIQECAGRTDSDPALTFADLESVGIQLRLVTTDLSLARPVTLPLAEDSGYLFTENSLEWLLPPPIRRHLVNHSTPTDIAGTTYRTVPGREMPVALAARLSLSFPVLLSAVPFFALHEEISARPLRHWLSDGGITSNFPIHFFDKWLPRHPTFGLSLQPAGQHRRKDDEMVEVGRSSTTPRWTATNGVSDFASQIFDASRNWRDAMQAQLPGSRFRIASIYLRSEEGGLNLNMPADIVKTLDTRGQDAGKAIVAQFDWPKHQFTRYLTWMQMMQIGLHEAGGSFSDFKTTLDAGNLGQLGGTAFHDGAWADSAGGATQRLVMLSSDLGEKDAGPLFNTPDAPIPTPVMRVVPDV